MNDISYTNWIAMNDKALAEHIGLFIQQHRLEKNKTQDAIANEAGISRSTLSLLERGETVTLSTLIQVLRVLDQLHVMEVFNIQKPISPLALMKMEKEKKQRARGKNKDSQNESDW